MTAVSTTGRLHERCFHCAAAVRKNDCVSAAEATLGRLAAHHYNVQRNVEKMRQILHKRTNVRRNTFSVQYLSYLLNVFPYVSSFVQCLSYFLNVSLYVIALRCYSTIKLHVAILQ